MKCPLLPRGGAELLFGSVKEHHVTLPNQSEPCEYNLFINIIVDQLSMNIYSHLVYIFFKRHYLKPRIGPDYAVQTDYAQFCFKTDH